MNVFWVTRIGASLICGVMRHTASESPPSRTSPWQAPSRPFLLGIFAGVLVAQAAILPVMAVVTFFVPVEGENKWETLALLAAWFIFAVYFGPALWRGRWWARNVLVVASVVAAVVELVVGALNVRYQGSVGLLLAVGYVLTSALIPSAILVWYLCFKANVREFFEHRSGRGSSAA